MTLKKIGIVSFFIIAAIALVGCTAQPTAADPAPQRTEQVQQSQNQNTLIKAQPAPKVEYSAGRQNLIDRMNRMNDKTLVGYIYLLSDSGQVVASYVTKGRPTSMQQYLTSYDMLVRANGELCRYVEHGGYEGGYYQEDCYNVESPDFDGTYGYHPEGIFFFTDTNAMVEWTGKYVWTDQPLTVRTQPVLVRKIK